MKPQYSDWKRNRTQGQEIDIAEVIVGFFGGLGLFVTFVNYVYLLELL